MKPRPERRARHPLTPGEEHVHLVAGSRLFNKGLFYETHEEWEEVWRRAEGARRELLRGLIQVAVGYEHWKRGNGVGARSLLLQGVRRLRPHARKPGVRALIGRASADAAVVVTKAQGIRPPKVMLRLRGFRARGPANAIEIEVPAARRR